MITACWWAAVPVLAQPYGLEQRPVVGAFLNNALPRQEQTVSGWQAVVAFPSISFDDPTFLIAEPRTNRLYVCGRQGPIHFFVNNPATTSKTLFLDLTPRTQGYHASGVLGLAFHPEFGLPGSTNRGYVYVYYSYSPAPLTQPIPPPAETRSYNRLSRFTVPDGSLVADPNSELVLINQYDRHVWHNGGGMFFGPDGFLYLSVGDEGGNYDPYDQAQKINASLFSGVLRIDVDMDPTRSHPIRRQPQSNQAPPNGWPATYSQQYYIPNDNPWLDPGGSVLEEFYALGFRSPHRLTYDPPSGRIWSGDVGQESWEELNIIEKGGNYQWAYREGTHPGPKAKPGPLIGVDKPPVYDYPHANGNNCVIGGYVYRGAEHAAYLTGQYIFGDNGSGRVWAMAYDGVSTPQLTELCIVPNGGTEFLSLSTIGLDQNGELLMCVMGQGTKIYKLAAGSSQGTPPPALLSQTGAFTNLATLSPSAALVPFTVNAPLWSDNAVKFRWLAVPNNGAPYTASETIGFATNGAWTFPQGTVLVKHFELPIDDTDSALRKRLETRFLVHGTNGSYYGLAYKWRADNSDADLLPGSLNETNLITTASGVRTQVWYYPSRQDCLVCHNVNANQVLGPRTCQMNGDYTYPDTGVADNQIRTLNHIGMFSAPVNEASLPSYPRSVPLTDTNATLELRVRSYLDANCAHCHRPNGPQGAFFDARLDTPLAQQGLVNGPVANPLGISGAKVVVPQSPGQSILHVRDNLVGLNQMPPLAKNVIDTNYIDVLAQWINIVTSITPPPIPIGNTNDGTLTDTISANSINGMRHQATGNITVDTLHAKVGAITGRYKCAIYTDNNGLPGVLLGGTAEVQNPAAGWRSFALTAPLTLTNGQYYWLAIWANTGASIYYSAGTIPLRYGTFTYGAWPSPLTLPTAGTPLNYCIYASGSAAPPATLNSIAVTPVNPTNSVGATRQFTATGTYSDGSTQNLTSQTVWTSSVPAVATINSGGLATAVSAGNTTITATLGSVSGNTTLTVQPLPLTLATTSLPNGTVNVAYAATLTGSGGTPPYQWSIFSGALPPGLTLNTNNGAITGTPTTAGTSNFTARLEDSGSPVQSVTRALAITVTTTLTAIAVTPVNPAILVGAPQQFTATGTYSDGSTQNLTSQVTWTSSSSGVATINTGGLATSASAGNTTIGATLGSVSGNTILTVQSPLTITTATLPGGVVNVAYTATLTGSGGTTPYKWSLLSGALPAGLTLNTNNGVITGTPTTAGTSNFTARLVDSGNPGQSVTKALSLAVTTVPRTIGNTNNGTLIDTITANSINALRHQATSDITVDTMQAKVGAITGRYKCAMYSDNNGLPGVLLGSSAEVINPSSGWQTFALTSPVVLTNGQYYWLAIWGNAGASIYYSAGTIPLRYATYTYGTWPSPVTLGTVGTPLNYCVYASGGTVPPATLTSIAVTPVNPTILSGNTQQFVATGTYSDGSTQNVTAQAIWTSSNPGAATINGSGLATAGAVGSTTIGAALGGVNGNTTLTVQPLLLTLGTTSLPNGTVNVAYAATLTGGGGTPPYKWSIFSGALPPGLTLNTNNGAITGTPTTAGTSNFTARLEDSGNPVQSVTRALAITVTTTLTSIAVTPANPTILVGATQQFTATGTYSDGSTQNLTSQVNWNSSSASVATINSGGLATGAVAGGTTITAALGVVSGNTTLTVQPLPLTIATTSLPNGTVSTTYAATLTGSGGTTPYKWSIFSGALPPGLTLNTNNGAITGTPVAAGTNNFTVQVSDAGSPVQSVTKPLSLVVTPASPIATIWPGTAVSGVVDGGSDSSVEVGVKFRSDEGGSIVGIRFYKLSSNTGTHQGNLWTSTGALLASATFTGETASGWQQVNFTTPVVITAGTVYVASYHVNGGHYGINQNYFSATGVDNPPLHALANGVNGGNGVYAYGASSVFPNLTYNAANYWVDVAFQSGPPITLTSIAVTPANPTVTVGGTRQFTATGTYSDGSTQNVTSQAAWVSSNAVVATVNGVGLAAGVAAGGTTIAAVLNGVTGGTTLTVAPPPTLVSIAVTPVNPTIMAGGTQPFTATGNYSDGSTQNVTSQATWVSSNTVVATVNGAGLALGVAGGSTTIAAVLNGVTGGTTIIVLVPPTLTSIAVTPVNPTIMAGGTQPFTATGNYSDGSTQNVTSQATWVSSNAVVATVNGVGLAAGVAEGSTTIAAVLNGVAGGTTLTILPLPVGAGDYRSVGSGVWTDATVWQTNNGTAWVAASRPPTNNVTAGVITVRNGHTVTVSAGVTVDQVLVEAGGQMVVNSGQALTLADGTGPDLDVFGTLQSAGVITVSGGATVVFESGAIYQHNQNGGTIPPAAWNAAATCLITGTTTTLPGGLAQLFGHFTWNCAGQSAALNLETSMSVAGNFTVIATGSSPLRLLNSTTARTLTVGGNYSQTGGTFNLKNGSGAASLNLAGNFLQTGGTFTLRSGNTGGSGIVSVAGNFSLSVGTFNMSSVGAVGTLNVAGNFAHPGGTITETSSGSGAIIFNGTAAQSLVSGGTVANNISFTVNSGATLLTGTSLLGSGSSGAFTLASGGTLGIGSSAGITTSGTTGNIRVTGTRTYSTGANYLYNGTAAQVTGNGLPATVNNLTIANAAGLTLNGTSTVNGTCLVNAGARLLGTGRINNGPLTLNGTVAPGGSVGRFTTARETWNGGAGYRWEINNATGAPGTGWDLLSLTTGQGIDLQATPGNPFILKLVSLNGSTPGLAANFNNTVSNMWTLAITTNATVTNFSADKFVIDATQFSNNLDGGTFSVEQSGSDLRLKFTPLANPILLENALPGNPASEWDVSGDGDSSIQGFATQISVNRGEIVRFKVDTSATSYRLDIYRLGYYGGQGARFITTVLPSVSLPQDQPNPITDAATGLIDCGNWAESASWQVPANAVSGVYIAKLVRPDTGGSSHVVFVVRDDNRNSDLLFQTSDTEWNAYNYYGGNSLYVGAPAGRAYKVSYNRPLTNRGGSFWTSLFTAEYPMIRWLEANGYSVSYSTGVDTDRRGSLLLRHRVFLSVGHDEYWSGAQRANVEAARAAGVHLAFFSGNEIFWKTRWEPSIDGSGTAYRTLVCYKETHANAKIDPSSAWTGTWRDPRFSPPADGGRPENALSGTIFKVNGISLHSLQVPAAYGTHRFWRNTSVATLSSGQVATFGFGTLGFEWDECPDNGFQPPAQMRLSLTTVSPAPVLLDYGSTYGSGSATHSLSLYRHSSGALVFSAGTIQWSWGLDDSHDHGSAVADVRIMQATVNLLADMGAQPGTLQAGLASASQSTDTIVAAQPGTVQSGLVPASQSTDTTRPASTISSPVAGATLQLGSPVKITGSATDSGGQVWGAEVSTDDGINWRAATGRGSWTYAWIPSTPGSYTIKSRAFDDSGNLEIPSAGVAVTVSGSQNVVGNTAEGTLLDIIGASSITAGRFQATNDLTVTTMYAKVGATTGRYQCAIYTDSGGQPSQLLRSSAEVINPGSGWQTFALTASQALTNGQFYWLAIWSDAANAQVYYSSPGGTIRWGAFTYGGWPDPISTSGEASLNYCIYAAGSAPILPTGLTSLGGGDSSVGLAAPAATTRPQILSIETRAGVVTITASAQAGRSYVLEYVEDLGDTNWVQVLPPVFATDATVTMTDTVGDTAKRYYRIVQLLQQE